MSTQRITYSYQTWLSSICGSLLVGSIGLLPIFVVPNEQSKSIRSFHFDSIDQFN